MEEKGNEHTLIVLLTNHPISRLFQIVKEVSTIGIPKIVMTDRILDFQQ